MSNPPIDQAARDRAIFELATTFLVEASAGTGKTTLAIARLLNIVRTGTAKMEEIVAITFTEKAAGELKMRLRDSMEMARREAKGEERKRFEDGVRMLELSHISTIHGFCSWLLKERPIEAQVDPGFQVLDALETELLLDETWREWVEGQMESSPGVLKRALYAEISLAQLREIALSLVQHRDRLDLDALNACERSVADDVAELKLILAKLKPKLANCSDDTDAGYRQIKHLGKIAARIESQRPHQQEYELIHTVHIRSNAGNRKNWNPDRTLIEIKDAYPTLKSIPARRCDALLRDISAWLKGFVAAFERAKAVRGALDFDDLLLKTRQLLRRNLLARAEFQRRFKVLLVDEFQDTDPVQAEIVFFLAEKQAKASRWDEIELEPGKLFLVGDPKQSIYRFRRADIEIYESAKKLVARQGAVLHITQSFRTASSLIAWVDFVFEQLIIPPKDGGLYQPSYVGLHASPDRLTRSARLCLLEPTEEQRALLERAKIEAIRAAEAREVARMIEHLVTSEEWKIQGRKDTEPRAPRFSDFAILLHAPHTSLGAYETALQQQDIPYKVEGGKDYFQSQEVRAVCALLLALDDPMNTRELVGVLRSAVFGFSDEQIYLWARENTLSYLNVEALLRSAASSEPALRRSAATSVTDALAVLHSLHQQRNEHSFAGFLELIYRELKLPELYSLKSHGQQRVANLMKLIAVARRVQGAGLLSLREFVEYLRTTALDRSEEGQSPCAETGDDVVSVLSIHMAKGLEWSIVIVGDLGAKKGSHPPTVLAARESDGRRTEAPPTLAPLIGVRLNRDTKTTNYNELERQEKLREAAEEKRLLYVAATRARDHLVLPWFANKGHYLDVIRGVFDPEHPGEAISMFHRRTGEQSRMAKTRTAEPIRVSLHEPDPKDRAEVERLIERRVQWLRDRDEWLVHVNRGRAVATPSRLAEEKKEWVKVVTGEQAKDAERAAWFGTVMHEVLSRVDFMKPVQIATLWKSLAAQSGLHEHEAKRGAEMLERFAQTELFGRIAHAKETHREMPFTLQGGKTILEGIIDLVFKEGNQWFLVDYKTDPVAKADAALHAQRYRPQLDAYAAALQTIGGMRAAKILMFLWPAQEVRLG